MSRRMKQEGNQYSFKKGKSELNHLLFMDDLKLYGSNQNEADSLVRTVEIATEGIGMKFGIERFDALAMKRGREVEYNGIELENGK